MQGLILIDKPQGITSFTAVRKIKKLSGEKRVGHTGTLDPLATGVLPVFIGRATVLSSFLSDADKTYVATVKLGIKTDTFDITGSVLEERQVNISEAEIDEVLKTFEGEQLQTPPMFSAIKKDGVRLYSLARQGESVQIEPRKITVYSVSRISDFKDNSFKIRAHCSKGTYIRSLCNDIGLKLGCGATMSELRRVSAHGFDISECVLLDSITEENIENFLLSEEKAVENLRVINVTEKQAVRFTNGGELDIARLKINDPKENEKFRVKFNDLLLGIGFFSKEKNSICISNILNKI
ncbi:MAG: tRNA pseudouridine(55) synthase TruB [Ruminococcaceae bacterium]|nr:tRNA pseudouridine(55) synthase TruB [Oscillospiraceae bacterium]